MYNIAIYIYLIGVAIGSLFNKKIKKMWRGEREAVDLLKEKVDPTAKYVWFHAASLGEFEQGRPLIEQLRATHPEYKILLTFFSPSGYEVRKNYEGADIVCYLPLDTIRNARRFLRAVHPVMAFFNMNSGTTTFTFCAIEGCLYTACQASSDQDRCSSSGMGATMPRCSTA